jgi:hypothetical protein
MVGKIQTLQIMIFVLTFNTTHAMEKVHPPQTLPTYTVSELIKAAYHDNEPWVSAFERAYLAQNEWSLKKGLSGGKRYFLYSRMINCEIFWADSEEKHAYWSAVHKELREAGK